MIDFNKEVKRIEMACIKQLDYEKERRESLNENYFLPSYDSFCDEKGNVEE